LGHKSSAQLLGILFWIQYSANSPNYRMLLAVVCTLLTYLLVQLNWIRIYSIYIIILLCRLYVTHSRLLCCQPILSCLAQLCRVHSKKCGIFWVFFFMDQMLYLIT